MSFIFDFIYNMAAFELPSMPSDLNSGVSKYDTRTVNPTTSINSVEIIAVNSTVVFEWEISENWWLPSQTYFSITGHFTGSDGVTPLPFSSDIGYCDNWVPTLFSRITVELNGQSCETIDQVPQADTMCLYSTVDQTYLRSFATASGVGESLMTRFANAQNIPNFTGVSFFSPSIVATWRPPSGIFSIPTAIPPGLKVRVTFNISRDAGSRVVQSAASKIYGTNYRFFLDTFTMQYSTVEPDKSIMLPESGVIEFNSINCNSYSISAGSTTTLNVTLPSRSTRLLIGLQDKLTALNGQYPVTQFTLGLSDAGPFEFASYLQNIYVNFNELGYTFPQSPYNFTAGFTPLAKYDLQRAYTDWINITKGCSSGFEGSVPMGTYETNHGASIVAITGAGPIAQSGDPSNLNQLYSWNTASDVVRSDTAYGKQTARFGWMGQVPIFAFPVVRRVGSLVSRAIVTMTFSNAVVAGSTMYLTALYTNTIVCARLPDGSYAYDVSGATSA